MEDTFDARYRRYSENGNLLRDEDGKVRLRAGYLIILSPDDQELRFKFAELEELSFRERTVRFTTPKGEQIELYYLSNYPTLSDTLRDFRSQEIIKNLPVPGSELKSSYGCKFRLFRGKTGFPLEDRGKIDLYESFLTLLPKSSDILVFLYSNLKSISFDRDNRLVVLSPYTEERLEVFSLNENFEQFKGMLDSLIQDLTESTEKLLAKTLPEFSSLAVKYLASLMRGGRAIEKKEVDRVDHLLFKNLEDRITEKYGYKGTYEFLRRNSKTEEKLRIGIREKGEVWYQIPLQTKVGPYIVVEDTSSPEHNTLVIKVKDFDEKNTGVTMDLINKNLLFLNFNFSALYKSKNDILEGKEENLKVIYNKFDFLLEMRNLFFFRIFFQDRQTWERDLRIIIGL